MDNSKDKEISKLRKEVETLRTYLDLSDSIRVAIAPDQKVTYINKKGCDVLGYAREEIVGKNWFDNFLPKKSSKQTKKVFEDLVAGKVKQAEYYENPILAKSGEERLISWHNTLLRDPSGRIVSTVSSGRDITERSKAEEALARVLEKMKIEHKGKGLADIEDTIRTRRMTLWKIRGKEYNSGVIKLVKTVSGMYDKTLYVSINKPFKSVAEDFEKNRINRSRFQFICVGSGELPIEKSGGCAAFVETRDMTALGIKVGELLGKTRPKALILDSFNTMSAYMDDSVVARFAQDLILKLEAIGCRGVFPVVATEAESPLMNSLEMFMDAVTELG